MRFKFVHAADLHLDSPFVGVGALDNALGDRLRDASLQALDRIVAKAIDVDAAFVVFAGDLYDGPSRGIRAQIRFRDALARLSAKGIRSFVAHGNHDPELGSWSWATIRDWPEGVTVFEARTPESIPVERHGERLATVHGVSYGAREERENLALRFPVVNGAGGGLHVGVLHCAVEGESGQFGHETYSPCTLEDLRSRNMGYWALGHVHRHKVLARDPWVVYPGNTQGRGLAAVERGRKGAVVVEVADGKVVAVAPFETDSARFFEVEVDIAKAADVAGVADLLGGRAEAIAQEHEGVALVLRGRLTGRGEVYADLHREKSLEPVLAAVRDLSGPNVYWLDIEDATAPALDLAKIREAGDLRSAVLETWDAWRNGGEMTQVPDWIREDLGRPGEIPAALLDELLREAMHDVVGRLSTGER